jgi:hypothetical protein
MTRIRFRCIYKEFFVLSAHLSLLAPPPQMQSDPQSIVSTVLEFVQNILSLVFSFLHSLLGDNTPVQPAISPSAGMSLNSTQTGTKALCLALLGLFGLLVFTVVCSRLKLETTKTERSSHYRNMDLAENFLYSLFLFEFCTKYRLGS